MEGDKWLFGLNLAKSLNFTDAHYREASKNIDSPDNANQILVALLDASSKVDQRVSTCASDVDKLTDQEAQVQNLGALNERGESSSSSCYSSITSFPISPDQSLESLPQPTVTLKKIYIDGSNVAKTHGKDVHFSWTGIALCVRWFIQRHHRVKVFVPAERCSQADKATLAFLNQSDALVKTPDGCNDDLFIIEAARQNNGIIVSNDQYRDEKRLNEDLRHFIYINRLPYAFVDDLFLPAMDPRGRFGPTLDEFLTESSQSNLHHNRLFRTKSHQRSIKYGSHLDYQQPPNHCSIHATRSLPVDKSIQNTLISNTSDRPPIFNQRNHNDREIRQRQQIKRTISVAHNQSGSEHSETQANIIHKTALCRTKSHNI